MIVYMDLENLLKEKNVSKNKLCEFLDCTPNDIPKLK